MDELIARRAMMGRKQGGGGFLGYVSDGLVMMIDGIENTHNGHADSITELVNLVGTESFAFLNEQPALSDRLNIQNNVAQGEFVKAFNNGMTVELLSNMNCAEYSVNVNLDGSTWANGLAVGYENGGISQAGRNIAGLPFNNGLKTRVIHIGGSELRNSLYINGSYSKDMDDPTANYGFNIVSIRFFGNDNWGWRWCNGTFCALRIYNRALTDAEILANYQNDLARFNL